MTRIDFLSQLSSAIVEAILPEGQHLDLTVEDIYTIHERIWIICKAAKQAIQKEQT